MPSYAGKMKGNVSKANKYGDPRASNERKCRVIAAMHKEGRKPGNASMGIERIQSKS